MVLIKQISLKFSHSKIQNLIKKIISESILTYPVFEKILGAYKSYLRRYGDRAEEVMEADHKEFDEFTDQYFTEMKQKDPELN